MTTNTTNSQAASIDTYGDPRFEELSTALYRIGFHQAGSGDAEAKALADYIDAKLAQIEDAGWTAGRQQCYIDALERSAVAGLTHDRDGWKARATAAEAKLEAIRQGFAQLPRYGFSSASSGICEPEEFTELDDGRLVYHREVLALLQPQGQASDTSNPAYSPIADKYLQPQLPEEEIIKRAGEIFGFKPHKQDEVNKQKFLDFARWVKEEV